MAQKLKYSPSAALITFPSKYWRWLTIILIAEVGLFMMEVINSLVYTKYGASFNFFGHVVGILLTAFVFNLLERNERWLGLHLPWSKGIATSYTVQLVSWLIISLGTVLGFFILVRVVLGMAESRFISALDIGILLFVTGFITTLLSLIRLGFFVMHKWKEASTETERFRKENMEFRFEMLRNQVNPHFLFNSLNTLAALVHTDADTASDFVRQMAKVYRYVLENREKEVITLKEELNFLDAYLFLVRIRFQRGLEVSLQVSDELRQCLIAPITLQLLIENAIKHNIVAESKPLRIEIVADEATHELRVRNNLQLKAMPEPSTKTGLNNIRNRYAYLTTRELSVEQGEGYFQVTVPLLHPETKTLPAKNLAEGVY